MGLTVPLPHRANLKYFNTLVRKPVGEIKFRTDVSRWPALRDECTDYLFNFLLLELT